MKTKPLTYLLALTFLLLFSGSVYGHENKKRVLLACNRVELSLSDFVTGATLEATDFVIDKYL
jgi:hypothetical protein